MAAKTSPASSIYASKLIRLGHGYPLYQPTPTPLSLGDVGYLTRGQFVKLFNVSDRRTADGAALPDDLGETLPKPEWSDVVGPEEVLGGPVFCSDGVRFSEVVTESGRRPSGHRPSVASVIGVPLAPISTIEPRGTFALPARTLTFLTPAPQPGAALITSGSTPPTSTNDARIALYASCIRHQVLDWAEHAWDVMNVDVRAGDLLLVTGYTCTSGRWGTMAFAGERGSVNRAPRTSTDMQGAYVRDGWYSKGGRVVEEGEGTDKIEQCIFIHAFKAADKNTWRRQRWGKKAIRVLGVVTFGWVHEARDEDYDPEWDLSKDENTVDPLQAVIDYIFLNAPLYRHVRIALTHDHDVLELVEHLQGHRSYKKADDIDLDSLSIPEMLKAVKPKIVVRDGVAMLEWLEQMLHPVMGKRKSVVSEEVLQFKKSNAQT